MSSRSDGLWVMVIMTPFIGLSDDFGKKIGSIFYQIGPHQFYHKI